MIAPFPIATSIPPFFCLRTRTRVFPEILSFRGYSEWRDGQTAIAARLQRRQRSDATRTAGLVAAGLRHFAGHASSRSVKNLRRVERLRR